MISYEIQPANASLVTIMLPPGEELIFEPNAFVACSENLAISVPLSPLKLVKRAISGEKAFFAHAVNKSGTNGVCILRSPKGGSIYPLYLSPPGVLVRRDAFVGAAGLVDVSAALVSPFVGLLGGKLLFQKIEGEGIVFVGADGAANLIDATKAGGVLVEPGNLLGFDAGCGVTIARTGVLPATLVGLGEKMLLLKFTNGRVIVQTCSTTSSGRVG